ncbi:hypothetical protein PARA125_000413 [Parachlamydia sp. AcF125]|nr:hypothetical protein [Parachlamydia sp. AcF125]
MKNVIIPYFYILDSNLKNPPFSALSAEKILTGYHAPIGAFQPVAQVFTKK